MLYNIIEVYNSSCNKDLHMRYYKRVLRYVILEYIVRISIKFLYVVYLL